MTCIEVMFDSFFSLYEINLISLLTDKKKKFPSKDVEKICGSCRVKNVEDIPDDMQGARYTHFLS